VTTQKAKTAGSNGSGREINLDQARAARAEASGEPVVLIFKGKKFSLPPELPAEFALCADEGRLRESIHALFGETKAGEFFKLEPSLDDLTTMLDSVKSMYGLGEGE
jgi:hypothetical protein